MSPERTLWSLLLVSSITGGWLYGSYLKKSIALTTVMEAAPASLTEENIRLTKELESAKEQLAHTRSLLNGAPYPIPEDLIAFVEKDLNLVFTQAPLAQLASPNDLRDAVERNLDFVYGRDGLGMMERTWELLGLLPAGHNLRGQWIMIETVEARGLFEMPSGKIYLSQDFDGGKDDDLIALVRLLARQLLWQNFPRQNWSDHDDWHAWFAIHRGAALSCEQRFARRYRAGKSEPDKEEPRPPRAREDLLAQLSATVQALANFPYVEGQDFVQKSYLESRNALIQTLRNPPKNSAQVIFPETDAPPAAGTDGNRIGAFGLRMMLDPLLGLDASQEVASQWRADHYIYQDDTLTWHLRMADTSSLEQVATAIEEKLLPVLREFQQEREITLERASSRLTFTNRPQNR